MADQLNEDYNVDWSIRKWQEKHDTFTKKVNAKRDSPEHIEWLSKLPESIQKVEHRGITARVLKSPLEIRTEGDSMRHCVGSYTSMVESGDYLVYSTSGDDVNPTTIGLRLLSNGKWEVSQQYGFGNNRKDVSNDHETLALIIGEKLNGYSKSLSKEPLQSGRGGS